MDEYPSKSSAGKASTNPSRTPGTGKWLWGSFMPKLLFFVGLLLVVQCLLEIFGLGPQPDIQRVSINPAAGSVHSTVNFGRHVSLLTLTIKIVFGATMSCVAAILVLRRVTLLRLLAFVFLIGIAGFLPQKFKRSDSVPGNIEYVIKGNWDPESLAKINAAMQPEEILKTLPLQFYEDLGIKQNACVKSVKVLGDEDNGQAQYRCAIVFDGDADSNARKALFQFYVAAFECEVRKQVSASGKISPVPMTWIGADSSAWSKYADAWSAQYDPLIATPPSNAPSGP